MVSKILVPMDNSEMSQRALEYALKNHPEAEITVLHVVGEASPMMGAAMGIAIEDNLNEAADKHAKKLFDRARDIAVEYDVDIHTNVQIGQPAKAILNRADNFDIVVIGSHGGSLADRLFIGNVAQKVFRRSPVPVIVVR